MQSNSTKSSVSVIGADRPHTIQLPTGHVLTRVFGGKDVYIYDAATWRYGTDVSKAQRFDAPVTVGVWGPGWYTFNPGIKPDAKRQSSRQTSAEIALARSQALSRARLEASGVTATARREDTRVAATAAKAKQPKQPKQPKATADKAVAAINAKLDGNASQDHRDENPRYVRPDAGQPVAPTQDVPAA